MLHMLSSIKKHQEQIWHNHKNGQVQPRVIIWKKPQGMGIQPLGTSSGSILKLLLFPSFCNSSRKIPFASLFCMTFCFISYMYIKPQGKKRQLLVTMFLMQPERSYHFDHWLNVSKNSSALWFYAHFFLDLIYEHSPWAGADNPLGPKFWCQHQGLITMVICCKFKKNLFNLWLYTHLVMI